MSSPSPWRAWTAWIAANAAGELAGLGLVFTCGLAMVRLLGEPAGAPAILGFAAAAALLGAAEGCPRCSAAFAWARGAA